MTTEKTTAQEHRIRDLLIDLGICDATSIRPYYPQVRDRDDIAVLRCEKSGVILLSDSRHMDVSHYEEKQHFRYWSPGDRRHAINTGIEDLIRRKNMLQPIVANRKWMDVGTGSGGILDELSSLPSEVFAVEPQQSARDSLSELGYTVYPDIESVSESEFDVITLFHVLEHFINPLEDLESICRKLAKNGKVIIEIPHANDFLISFLEHEGFKQFTFWSEHLILHTRHSLTRFLEKAGFSEIIINGFQRYPLANHLHWLAKDQPGGHQKWSFLRTKDLDTAYSQMLTQIDKTDTLIATATKR